MDDFFGFEPVDLDDELFLTEVPLDLLKETIRAQFDDPLENRRSDYIQSFITKYTFSRENGHEDDQYVYDEIYDEFIRFMEEIFEEKLGVAFPEINSMDDEDALELLQLACRFFIKNIKKNFTTLLKNYVDNNRPTILSKLEQKKDVTTLSFRTEIDDEDDILIISNLGIVIGDYLNEVANHYDVDQFLEGCVGDSLCLETEYVSSKYAQFKMVGNFVEKYVGMINLQFRYKLESSIRNHILKKYNGKRKGDPIVPDSERPEETTDNVTEDET